MANYESLKTAIRNAVYENGNNEITGQGLQDVLEAIVNSLGAGYQFASVATTETEPGTPDANVMYIAGAGTYPNFGATKVPRGSLGVFRYNGSWDYSVLDVASWADASNKLYYNTQAGNVAAKTIQADGFTLQPGGWIKIHFDNANTVDNPTLNVNNTGAHTMTFNGRTVSATNSWKTGETVAFYYDNYGVGIWHGIRLVEYPDYINVNELVGQTTPFASASAARSAIPQQNRKPGLNISYLLSTGKNTSQWVQDMFIGDDVTDWGVADNWKTIGPISVTQNTETGYTDINIGSHSYPVASVEKLNQKEGLYIKKSTDYRHGFVVTNNGKLETSNTTRLSNNFPISYKNGDEEIIALGNYQFYVNLYDESYLSYVGFICEDGALTTDASKEVLLMNHFDLSTYPDYFVAITIKDADNPSAEISPSQGVNILIGQNKHQKDYVLANTTNAEINSDSIEERLYQLSANRLISKTYDRIKDVERLKKYWLDSNTQSIIVWCKNSIWDSNTVVSDWTNNKSYYQMVLDSVITSYTYFGFYFKNNNDANLSPSDVDFYYNTVLYNLTHKGNISLSWFISSGSYVKNRLCTIAFPADNASLLKDYWLSNDFEYELNLIESNSTDVSQGGTSLTGWTNKRAAFIAALNNVTKTNIFIYFRRLRNPNESINSEDVLWLEYKGDNNEILNTLNKVDFAYSLLKGKTFAVMCDSIGTHGNSGQWHNVAEVVIGSADVGVELKAYLTHYDLYSGATQQDPIGTYTGLTIGGVSFTEDQIGTEITFTPTADDIGKSVGKVYDWNGNDMDVWWVNLAKKTGMTPIPVCWASSSYSSHESSVQRLKTAEAWHDAQIRKCGVRVDGSMIRLAPDYIILARGCNDMTHQPYDRLTSGFFDDVEWDFPATDVVEGNGYGLKEALSLTIKKLWAAYPYAKIILCTIPYVKRIDYDNFPTNNDTDQSPLSYASNYCQWNDAIRETADFFGCGLIDFSKDGITHQNLLSFTADNVHPNTAGHALMGLQACKSFI